MRAIRAMRAKERYHVGIYLRLSREDVGRGAKSLSGGGIKLESDSISSQRELCRSFVQSQNDMEIYDIYIDM